MTLKIRNLTPRSLARAIVSLAVRTGNKTVEPGEGQGDEVQAQTAKDRSYVKFKRTTITVETERFLTLRVDRHRST